MANCNPVATPLDINCQLHKTDMKAELADITLYQQIIESLMHLIPGTRPDLAYTVSWLAQYSTHPTKDHRGAAKHVLHYLKGTRNIKLTYERLASTISASSTIMLSGYFDADYANDKDNRKSYSEYTFALNGNTICWKLQKQRCVSTSTTEAEYIAMSIVAK